MSDEHWRRNWYTPDDMPAWQLLAGVALIVGGPIALIVVFW